MNIAGHIVHALATGLLDSWLLFWESLYGLVLGFLISAIVQLLVPQTVVRRFASENFKGIAAMAGFGIVSSSCSYAAAAVTRALYQRGAGPAPAFAFMISSTNMNIAILILFWVLVGWQFALAEFLGGIIIIAIVATGLSLLFSHEELEALRAAAPGQEPTGQVVEEDVVCGMKGQRQHAVKFQGRTYLFCNAQHAREFAAHPQQYIYQPTHTSNPGGVATMEPKSEHDVETRDLVCGMEGKPDSHLEHGGQTYLFCSPGCRDQFAAHPERYVDEDAAVTTHRLPLLSLRTWYEITQRMIADVKMLRSELLIGYLLAGFAEALIPHAWLASTLRTIGAVPVIGYVLLLVLGLAIAVATFVCSMGNVPVARFLKSAGIPLGANTTYIYGDLLILPLVQIYRKSFAPKLTVAFLGLFIVGACVAGALMDLLIGHLPGAV